VSNHVTYEQQKIDQWADTFEGNRMTTNEQSPSQRWNNEKTHPKGLKTLTNGHIHKSSRTLIDQQKCPSA